MATPRLRLGTRGSPLALAQAWEMRRWLAVAHESLATAGAVEIVVIRTSGDRITDRPLAEEGGKGLFTKEIEEALADGRIDLAVHSFKDMTTDLPDGLAIACHLPREDPRDAFVAPAAASLRDLPQGAVLGTSSLRRKAQALFLRPDLKIVPLRGNVGTRLDRLGKGGAGGIDATLLAVAGLRRLSLADRITAIMPEADMLPAPAQGVIAVEIRAGDDGTRELVAPLNDIVTDCCATAERALLATLDGSCRTPIAALAKVANGKLHFDALIIRPDGGECHRTQRDGAPADADAIGRDAGAELKKRGGADFFAER